MHDALAFFSESSFYLALTVSVYLFGAWLQKKYRATLCNAFLIAVTLCVAFLVVCGVPYADYQEGTVLLNYLLTPATVALGLTLYEQLGNLRENLGALLAGIVAGTLAGLACTFLLTRLFDFDRLIAVSLLPKGITTPIGLALSRQAGGLPALTMAAITVTGLTGALFGPALCKWLHITLPLARGVAYGTGSHVLGTSRAAQEGDLAAAAGSLSFVLTGLLTAVLYPILVSLFD